jgi:short subunit dehydrogenase-like uncharacterized protein
MTWMIYGANGYTGRLVAELAVARGHRPLLAGRSEASVRAVAEPLGLDWRAFALSQRGVVGAALDGVDLVAHCAGPFSETYAPVLEACLSTRTSYLDITGEIDVLEATLARHAEAVDAGVVVLPGSGFDVVPTDCLAAMVVDRLPDAVRLEIAFRAGGGMSRGTARTALAGMAQGGRARVGGVIVSVPPGWRRRTVEFATGPATVTSIPWGDVSTAFHSTGVPETVTYTQVPGGGAASRVQALAAPASRIPGVRRVLDAVVARRVSGPDAERRARSSSQVWARAETDDGRSVTGVLSTPNGYALTADSVVRVVERVEAGDVAPGAHTPSRAQGSRFVLELDGVTLHRLDDTPG